MIESVRKELTSLIKSSVSTSGSMRLGVAREFTPPLPKDDIISLDGINPQLKLFSGLKLSTHSVFDYMTLSTGKEPLPYEIASIEGLSRARGLFQADQY